MEQLVHLRLKSIYKAFKQNSSATAKSSNTRERQNDDPDEDNLADDPESLLQAAATAAKNSPAAKKRHTGVHGTPHSSNHHHHKRPSTADSVGSSSTQDQVNRYKEEKEKADAAAAALLAELEEEEEAVTKKKSKKKKKKARQQAKKDEEDKEKDDWKAVTAAASVGSEKNGTDDDFSLSDRSMEDAKPAAKSRQKPEVEQDAKPEEDSLEKEFVSLVETEDEEGLESLLASIKGVPGRAVLRKNAKKALKRLRLANCPPEEEEEDELASHSEHMETEAADEMKKTSRSGVRAETPTGTNFADTNGLLTIVSHSHNKPSAQNTTGSNHGNVRLRSECVMHMAPMIVGWVIGKGGVRIRDLMEESGARVWIDQDSMGPHDPRTVYVSGSRKSVETAVELIQDLVSKAPYSPQVSRQTTPVIDSSTGKGASKAAPKLPDNVDSGKTGVALKPKSGAMGERTTSRGGGDARSRHVLTCEPRFVPLLIGRRGWTIKNIQDSTGAKVDIDQSVNPRKITVSGPEENVERAIRMVRDVLSYPHAQLQGTAAEEAAAAETAAREKAEAAAAQPAPAPTPPTLPKKIAEPQQKPPSSPADANRRANSPPSSLIMTGDAKSTISASSSLSSTPEPSMTSVKLTAGVQQQHIPPGPIMSPQQPSRDILSGGGGDGAPLQPFGQQAHQQSPLGGQPIFPTGTNLRPSGDQYFAQPGSLDNNQMGTPLQQMSPIVPRTTFTSGTASSGFGSMANPHPQSSVPLQQEGAFHQSGFPRARSGPSDFHQSSMLNNFDNVNGDRSSSGSAPALWERQQGSDGFRLDAAVDFLEHSNHRPTAMPPTPASGSGMNDVIGLGGSQNPPIGLPPRSAGASGPLISAQGRDDSQIVDSLFGPPQGTAGNESSLLAGLQGLSLGSEGMNSTGLWGSSSTSNHGSLKGLPPIGGLAAPVAQENSSLFTNTGLATDPKSQSQFAWGESGNG